MRGAWRGAGVVELAALEKRYSASYRGFESLSLRQEKMTDGHLCLSVIFFS